MFREIPPLVNAKVAKIYGLGIIILSKIFKKRKKLLNKYKP